MPHHLLDLVEPGEGMDAARWVALADAAIAGVTARGRLPIVVGGTGLYVRALLHGVVDAPGRDPALRTRLEEEAAGPRACRAAPAARRGRSPRRRAHPGERPRPRRARPGDRGRRPDPERALRGPPLRAPPLPLPAPRPRRPARRAAPAHRGAGPRPWRAAASSTRPVRCSPASRSRSRACPSATPTRWPAPGGRSTPEELAARIALHHRRYARQAGDLAAPGAGRGVAPPPFDAAALARALRSAP